MDVRLSGKFRELYTNLKESEKGIGKKLQINSLLISLNDSKLLYYFIGNTTSEVPSS